MRAQNGSVLSLVLSLVMTLVLTTGSAFAQERVNLKTVDQRLKRVEKVMDQSLLDLLQQIESLKREIRKLRGELEAQAYELDRSNKRSRDLYLDTDQRMRTIESAIENPLTPSDGSAPAVPADNTNGSLDGLPVFIEDTAFAGAPPDGQAQAPPTGDEKSSYDQAYDLLATRQYDAATSAFSSFLTAFPNGKFADNAWYWRGEALYAEREFAEAIKDFETVVISFPQSAKVPDARLKIGFAQFELKQYKSARNTLSAVQQDYSGRSVSELARKRLQQMNNDGL